MVLPISLHCHRHCQIQEKLAASIPLLFLPHVLVVVAAPVVVVLAAAAVVVVVVVESSMSLQPDACSQSQWWK